MNDPFLCPQCRLLGYCRKYHSGSDVKARRKISAHAPTDRAAAPVPISTRLIPLHSIRAMYRSIASPARPDRDQWLENLLALAAVPDPVPEPGVTSLSPEVEISLPFCIGVD